MERVFVFLRPYGDRLQAEFVSGAENPYGDFGAVGDEDFGDRQEAGSPIGRMSRAETMVSACDIAVQHQGRVHLQKKTARHV
jgi:hypothetical protein